jgi:hypothetical protein
VGFLFSSCNEAAGSRDRARFHVVTAVHIIIDFRCIAKHARVKKDRKGRSLQRLALKSPALTLIKLPWHF